MPAVKLSKKAVEKARDNETAEELVQKDDATVEKHWETLDNEALDEEIKLYIGALQGLTSGLEELGISASLDELAEDPESGKREQIAGVDGLEGVDYTFGSVDDLDPSEWQVMIACGLMRSAHNLQRQSLKIYGYAVSLLSTWHAGATALCPHPCECHDV